MKQRMVSVRGGIFEVELWEGGRGRELLYLHGTWDRQWDPFLTLLAEQFMVIAPAHPGFGASTGEEHLRGIHDVIYYYLDLLDALALRNVALVGHSLGGMFAAELAAVQPERFTRLVLISPLGLWLPDSPVMDTFTAAPQELTDSLYREPEARSRAIAANTPPTEEQAKIAFLLGQSRAQAAAARYLWPLPNHGLAQRAHRVSAPTLIVWGQDDGVAAPRYADAFAGRISGATIEIVPGAGHVPHVDRPADVAKLVGAFISRGAPAPVGPK